MMTSSARRTTTDGGDNDDDDEEWEDLDEECIQVIDFAQDQSRRLSQEKNMQEVTQNEKKDEGRVQASEVSDDDFVSSHQDAGELEAEKRGRDRYEKTMKRIQHKKQWEDVRARRKERRNAGGADDNDEGGADENNEGVIKGHAGGASENDEGATDEDIEEDKKETRALEPSGHAQSGWGHAKRSDKRRFERSEGTCTRAGFATPADLSLKKKDEQKTESIEKGKNDMMKEENTKDYF